MHYNVYIICTNIGTTALLIEVIVHWCQLHIMIQATMIGKNCTSRTTGSTYVWEEDELSSLRADIRYQPRALQRTSI